MQISAQITHSGKTNQVAVSTNGSVKTISIPGKDDGRGSSVNGGELLFLALATCFCNDVYREAAKWNMPIASVNVEVTGTFGKEGEPASDIRYRVNVVAPESTGPEVDELIRHVDNVAEIHATLRQGINVSLELS